MNKKPLHFCKSVEHVLGLAAVLAEWQREFGDDWHWAKALLRPTDELARCYPKREPEPQSVLAYQIVWQDEEANQYVGSCPDGTGRIELRRQDLVVYALDTQELARRIATAMGLVCDHGDVEGVPHTTRIGAREPLTDDEIWVYIALQAGPQELSDTLARLAIRHDRPFMLITPTRASWQSWPEGVRARGQVMAMEDAFVVQPDGRWLLAHGFRPDTGHPQHKRAPVAPAPSAGAEALDLPSRNEMVVLRVLASAKTLIVQEEIAAATSESGRRISRKTVGEVLKSLMQRHLAEQPSGDRQGYQITGAGRALIEALDASH